MLTFFIHLHHSNLINSQSTFLLDLDHFQDGTESEVDHKNVPIKSKLCLIKNNLRKMTLVYAGIEAGGTSWVLAISHDDPLNIVNRFEISTTTPEETISKAINWLKTQHEILPLNAIGVASFGPVDLNPNSATYGFITTTPKPNWGQTNLLAPFKKAFPDLPIGFETDVNAPACYEALHGGHGDHVSSACYITVGTGVGVGVCVEGKAVHGHCHPEGGHAFVPLEPSDIEKGFQGTCPFHGSCVEGMVASNAIAARTKMDRHDLIQLQDSDPVWEVISHYLAYLCVNLTLSLSPNVIVIGGGISKRKGIFDKIRTKFSKVLNGYVKVPAIERYIKPSFHDEIGLLSSVELARQAHQSKC